jgi:hypothetical protein
MLQVVGFSIAGAGTYFYSRLTQSMKEERILQLEKKEDPRPIKDEETQMLE